MKIYKNELDKNTKEIAESLLFNGNGFIGIRNVLDENYYDDYYTNRHTYINGFYDTYDINYPEDYYGSAKVCESMLPVIDGQTTFIYINGEQVDINKHKVKNHQRFIDIEKGVSVRKFHIILDDLSETIITIKKIASFKQKELIITKYEFEKINHNLNIELETHINFKQSSSTDENDPRLSKHKNEIIIEKMDTDKQEIIFSSKNLRKKCYFKWETSQSTENKVLENRIILKTQLIDNEYIKAFTYSLNDFVDVNCDFELVSKAQKDYLDEFWKIAKVKIKSKDNIEESINYGSYALLCSTGVNNVSSIAAKGLSGLGYEGHTFWDAEMYIFPFFLKTNPSVAKSMLTYRINMLESAIENRKQVGYEKGALYPWRTITGLESSSFFEAGMAQHHINLDITYALIMYIKFTGDIEILKSGGWDMLYEICNMFASIVHENESGYHLDKITGPDEYSALVDDNFYTNVLLQYTIEHLLEYDQKYINKLTLDEKSEFKNIKDKIFLPKCESKKIYSQDRDFLNKGFWPQKDMKKPLLLNYHPLFIYRYQICKQADVVLATQLLFDRLNEEDYIKNTIEYFDKITTHDSSLSFSSYATVYAKLNDKRAYKYFLMNARLDLDNLHHNTKDGVHTASMGGTYQTITDGFASMDIKDNKLVFKNNLPKEIEYLEFNIMYNDELYNVVIEDDKEPIINKRSRNEKSSII